MSDSSEVNVDWAQIVQDLSEQIKNLTVHNSMLRAALANLQKENLALKSSQDSPGITLG